MTVPASKVSASAIRELIFANYNDTDVRFSNDDLLEQLNRQEKYRRMDLDVLDFEDVLLDLENSGMLRAIAQNFNTRYFRIWDTLAPASCKSCGTESFFSNSEESKKCPKCGTVV
ncbi:MAG: zinc ribbon domain-containing protein [Nitrososphaera sp.]|jgi:predicted Zn-ribbon and HTH transcriptional regulator